ncbi:mechanosensitive ion channel family protein [Aureibacillus halotolerans]|uniref:MscS family membrane protein n=1 Tax=Aureibacillus halotolerans TaxID=1508390 RepID=A0A4R6TWQ8_9BACI|nr:mechanosensitive ion channel family protein [Aureibacillus halotolerans]TDQ37182.1 MscS family membrane protein [Aureibacillus halotolerans]
MERITGFWNGIVNAPWTDIGIAVTIFLLFLLLRKLFTTYIFKLIIKVSRKAKSDFLTQLLLSFEKPTNILWIVIGTYLALQYLPYAITDKSFVLHTYRSILIFLMGWGLYRLSSSNSTFLKRFASKNELDEESMLIPFLSKILRVLVVVITIAVIVSEWGFNVNGFVAGLGLGGLAFALAAQETIANFFGGIVIISGRPFRKGDWIQTPTVEGMVEDISFLSTKVRTFANAVETVPNSTISKESIINWSEMTMRRVYYTFGVRHQTTPEQLEQCLNEIRTLLREHDGIVSHNFMVFFDKFTETSYEIYMYYFTKTTVWAEWFAIKEEVNFEILKILENAGVSISAPTRVVEPVVAYDAIAKEMGSSTQPEQAAPTEDLRQREQ